ncbi:uncharacterized protein SOCE26_049780 [Sorangium cellulosum]|uniref:Uncharacterized protein n=1 Tax=Sorangium cellulosum TaxID=56 RepID=A0A2L0EW87_SORCE|nr:hypothetical protein [Sorangium cellulosum]AUX43529.1 uncharacterized protein SOCE26_049780 [Sorangium cellulosum]
MHFAPLIVIGLPILTLIAVGLLGSTRRIRWWGAILVSLVLTPVGGLIAAILSGPQRQRRKAPPRLERP